MATIKFTIVGRYEAEEANYSISTPDASPPTARAMAAVDQASFDDGDVAIEDVLAWANERDLTVTFEAE